MSAVRTPAAGAMASLAPPDALNDDHTGLIIGAVILLGIVIAARALWGIHVARKAYSELCVHKAIIESPIGIDVPYAMILQRCARRFPDLSVRRIDGAIYRLTEKGIITSCAGRDGSSLIVRIPATGLSSQPEAA